MNRDLEALKKLGHLALYESYDALQVNEVEEFDIVQQALIMAQEIKKALKLIFEKNINTLLLELAENVDEYNERIVTNNGKLTQEEFELLKRWSNEITTILF